MRAGKVRSALHLSVQHGAAGRDELLTLAYSYPGSDSWNEALGTAACCK